MKTIIAFMFVALMSWWGRGERRDSVDSEGYGRAMEYWSDLAGRNPGYYKSDGMYFTTITDSEGNVTDSIPLPRQ